MHNHHFAMLHFDIFICRSARDATLSLPKLQRLLCLYLTAFCRLYESDYVMELTDCEW
jgi:hypothetical protein